MKTKKYWMVLVLLVYGFTTAFAQQKQVSGTVTDQDGLPLPGVSIIVVGTSNGTQTDFDGNYTIAANVGQALRFSYIGQKTVERSIGASSTINVSMEEDAQALEEVVVTALGIKREEKALGFASQKVAGDNLVKARDTDVSNALAGKVSGVQFLGAPSSDFRASSIRLRGNTNVLFIVDNIKVGSSTDINPDDIQEMTVLKGLTATALYGPEGRNGAIVITTRRAKEGKATITINQNTSLENVYLLPEYQNEYGGGYEQEFPIFNYDPNQHPASWASFDGQPMVEYYADESWGPRLDGTPVRHWDSWIEGDPEFGKLRPFSPNPNNIKDFYNTGMTNRTNITFLKGGEDYSIRTSVTRTEKEGIMPNTKRTQYDFSNNVEMNISEKFKMYSNLSFQTRKTKNFAALGYGGLGSNFNQWWQRQLDIDRIKNYKRNGQIVSWNINDPTNTRPLYWDSPYFLLHESVNNQTKNMFNGRLGGTYTFNEKLNLSIETRKTYNAFESDARSGWGGLSPEGYSENENTETRDELFGLINYHNSFGKFDISAKLGSEFSFYSFKNLLAITNGGMTVENFYSLGTSVDRPNVDSNRIKSQNRAVFMAASLGFDGVLYLDGTARWDWSSTANPNNNRVETYGVSGSFVFSELLPQNDYFTFGKLRAGYAEAPIFPDAHRLNPIYSNQNPYGSSGAMTVPNGLRNPELTGGVRSEIELGGELKFYRNRIGFDVTYFEKTDTDLPVFLTLDSSTGFTGVSTNSGEQFYKGLEFGFTGTPIKTENFEWELSANLATLTRWVNKLAEGVTVNTLDGTSQGWGGLLLQEREGEEWGVLYGRKAQRDDNGNLKLSSSGAIQYDPNQFLGNVLPDFTGGFTSNMRYKNFDLFLGFDFQKGGQYFSVSDMFINSSGLGIESVGNNALGNPKRDPLTGTGIVGGIAVPQATAGSDSGGILVEGVDATSGNPAAYFVEPSTYYGRLFGLSEFFLHDASYLKLRTLRLGYNLPNKFLKQTPFSAANIALYANNLWLIDSDLNFVDPSELENIGWSTGANNYKFIEGGQLPPARTLGLNISLTF
ncbi:MAG: SusC/RagA family TonB-linked outer membrane protein [Muricauda sp.]|nr:SusC/RagA family TonB-linked outer membrane protein [Allomuricauda sp.]